MIKAIVFDLDDTLYPVHVKSIDTKKVKAMLLRLKKKYKLIILSNGFTHKIMRKVKEAGYDKIVSKIYTPNLLINRKPIVNKLGKIAKEFYLKNDEILMVGDKVHTDVLAAKRAKVRCVFVTNGNKKIMFVKPDYIINSVLDLEKVLYKGV